MSIEHIITFPKDSSLGILFARRRGRERWKRMGQAQGQVTLLENMEYKLQFAFAVFGLPKGIIGYLKEVDCSLLDVIEMSVLVDSSNYWDQPLTGGDGWYHKLIETNRRETAATLKLKGSLVVKIIIEDFAQDLEEYEDDDEGEDE